MTFTGWRKILNFARIQSRTVTVHLTSGAVFSGIVASLEMDLVKIDEHHPETGKVQEHNFGIDAVIAITFAPGGLMSEDPQFGSPEERERQFTERMREIGRQMDESASWDSNLSSALGSALPLVYQRDIATARAILARLNPDQLRAVSAAASTLAGLADEELSAR
ncbi:hypothetical protein [Nonomuraea rubra]|uniref:Uncharacterized protein n=1 Tax=Nonomuraea rubra TaxID=46180 RepID=A0A7X0P1Y1_9ACTN|nr:hypothetical protein [Nonomuraea rubra]MBB6553536.1 hypothetical protein [Nonomuraea rubra]